MKATAKTAAAVTAAAIMGAGAARADSDSGSSRVIRGGSWDSTASVCRSAFRSVNVPSARDNNIGFRLVRTLP